MQKFDKSSLKFGLKSSRKTYVVERMFFNVYFINQIKTRKKVVIFKDLSVFVRFGLVPL